MTISAKIIRLILLAPTMNIIVLVIGWVCLRNNILNNFPFWFISSKEMYVVIFLFYINLFMFCDIYLIGKVGKKETFGHVLFRTIIRFLYYKIKYNIWIRCTFKFNAGSRIIANN